MWKKVTCSSHGVEKGTWGLLGKSKRNRRIGKKNSPRWDNKWILKTGRKGLDWTYVAQNRDKWWEQAGGEGLDWIYGAQDKDKWRDIVNTVMNLRVSQNAGNFLTSRIIISFSRRILLHWGCYLVSRNGGKPTRYSFNLTFSTLLEGTETNPEISRKKSQYSGQGSNLDPFIYEAAVVTKFY